MVIFKDIAKTAAFRLKEMDGQDSFWATNTNWQRNAAEADQSKGISQKPSNVHRLRLAVLHLEFQIFANGHGNTRNAYRSNRLRPRNTNTLSISSIKQHVARIEGKGGWKRNLNRGQLNQFLTKLQITSGYVIYELRTTQSLSQLKLLQILISNLFLMTAMEFAVELQFRMKQIWQIAVEGAWSCS